MQDNSLKYVFIVQGEGRGHMTQAISLYHILTKAGHQVVQVFIGKSTRRKIPDFFYDQIKAPIKRIPSPNFVTDRKDKSIRLVATVVANLRKFRTYKAALKTIHDRVEEAQPDVIINFYDMLGGLYNLTYRPKAQFVGVGHQYLANHEEFPFPKHSGLQKRIFLLNNRITALRAAKLLALSFSEYEPDRVNRTIVTPPLLRPEVKDLTPTHGDYFLAYMVNSGYGAELERWHAKYPYLRVHAFWDKYDAPETYAPRPNLTFHRINDKKFLELMAGCKGYLSTAGFESICEAMYLNKPVQMIPVRKQFEQRCNALDAQNAKAGIKARSFNFGKLLDFLPEYDKHDESAKEWMDSAEEVFLKELTQFSTLHLSRNRRIKNVSASLMRRLIQEAS